jgi:protein-tyrosine phosphatase
MGFFPAKEIRPGLWIGSEGDSRNPDFMAKHNIAFVVNCSNNIPFTVIPGVEYYRIPVDDAPSNSDVILSHWPIVVRAIDSVLQRGKGVLVHCRAGMQRSAGTVAAYLMYKYGLSAKNAMAAIKQRKSETFWPTPTFGVALGKYEKQLTTFNNAASR